MLAKIKRSMLYAAKTGMYEKEAQEIIALCADEAIDAGEDADYIGNNLSRSIATYSTAIRNRMK